MVCLQVTDTGETILGLSKRNVDLLQIENSKSFWLAAGREYSKIAIPNFGLLERFCKPADERSRLSSIFFFGLLAGGRGSVAECSIMARQLRTACQPFCCSTTSRPIGWSERTRTSSCLLLSRTVQLTACPVCSSHKTEHRRSGRRAVCAEISRRQIDEVHDRHRRTDRQCEPHKRARHKTGEQLVAGRIFAHRRKHCKIVAPCLAYQSIHHACRSVDQSVQSTDYYIREVPRSADYEYEYVWVSRILTRWLSVPRRTYWQNEYEYEYNVVGRLKLVDRGHSGSRGYSAVLYVCAASQP